VRIAEAPQQCPRPAETQADAEPSPRLEPAKDFSIARIVVLLH